MNDEEPELLEIEGAPLRASSDTSMPSHPVPPDREVEPSPPPQTPPPTPCTPPLPPLLSEILNAEPASFAAARDDEPEVRDRVLERLRALPLEPRFGTDRTLRWHVVQQVLRVLGPTCLTISARERLVPRIMHAWDDGTEEYHQWVEQYVPSLVRFLLDWAPDRLLPSRWQQAWWSFTQTRLRASPSPPE